MDIKKAVLMYFSPTGGTKKAAELLGERLGMETETLDITAGAPERRFMPGELAVFAFPVYGGRIPAPMYERLKTLRGWAPPRCCWRCTATGPWRMRCWKWRMRPASRDLSPSPRRR